MIIETERLVLRRWTTGDVTALHAILAQPAVARWLSLPTRTDVERTVARYEESWERVGFGRFAVVDKARDVLVGRSGLMPDTLATLSDADVEIGWALDARHWGTGIATEAARATLEDGFERVGLARVVAFTLADNVRSRAVMDRCGMSEGGAATRRGQAYAWYAVDAQTWRNRSGDMPRT